MTNPCQGHAAESARAEHMKEAERLMRQYTTAVLEQNYEAIALYHFTLLAHIQRGAVPDGWQLDESEAALLHHLTSPDDDRVHPPITLRVGNVRMDDGVVKFGLLCEYTDYPDEGATLLVEGQPTVAVPAPAEVPMPDIKAHLLYCSAPKTAFRTVWKDGIDVEVPAHWVEHFCRRYGDAREAAGYARGLKEAGRDAERYRTVRFLATAERDPLPEYAGDTSSPDAFDASIDHATAALRGEVKP